MRNARRYTLLSATLSCLLMAGCGDASDAPAAGADAAAAGSGHDTAAGRSFVGRKAAEAIGRAGEKLRTENIAVGKGTRISINGRDYGSAPADSADSDLPEAEITPGGELLIAGTAVDTTPRQQALLLEHRRQLEGLILAGMAIGVQGADIAGAALDGIGQAVFGGEEGRRAYEARIEAEASRIRDEAMELCALLPPLHESQQALAAALPAFVPYATMTLDDAEDCGDKVRSEIAQAMGDGTSA
ncbi:MAG TPA: hypothetical protein VIG97_01535 [Luteimonas sp.]